MLSCAHGPPGLLLRTSLAAALLAGLASLAPAPAGAVDLVLSDMTYMGSQAGEPALVLTAARARIEHDSDIAHLQGVRLDAVDEKGGSSLEMTCERAELDLTTSDFTATGNVRGRTADGHRFKTEAAAFEHTARVIESHVGVDILDPTGTRLEGEGFKYDVRSQRMTMRNAVVSESAGDPFQ